MRLTWNGLRNASIYLRLRGMSKIHDIASWWKDTGKFRINWWDANAEPRQIVVGPAENLTCPCKLNIWISQHTPLFSWEAVNAESCWTSWPQWYFLMTERGSPSRKFFKAPLHYCKNFFVRPRVIEKRLARLESAKRYCWKFRLSCYILLTWLKEIPTLWL